jgi:hypothetical protein
MRGQSGSSYASLLSRIPGITYIATADAGEQPDVGRQIAFVSSEFETLTGMSAAAMIKAGIAPMNGPTSGSRLKAPAMKPTTSQ